MKGLSRSPARRNEGFYRFLKPGALAQIRDSRINARSDSLLARSLFQQIDTPRSQCPAQAAQILTIDQVPDFLGKIYGPYCVRRKKLVASRSISLLNLNASPHSVLESAGGNNNALNNDAVVTH